MFLLGLLLLIIGFVMAIKIMWIIGLVLLCAGLVYEVAPGNRRRLF